MFIFIELQTRQVVFLRDFEIEWLFFLLLEFCFLLLVTFFLATSRWLRDCSGKPAGRLGWWEGMARTCSEKPDRLEGGKPQMILAEITQFLE
ncbi:hypothetical protein BZG02_12785 [Labilibaculum filiforme]|uniref:Uncharacterized protein n=1 Tax=Labilibaculum filiforme TaxID=1940526 RepID=A0A2N3HX32_9BACT|nr:hypothetical protein BZG02_12785 [Labilibaculum filiforme]